MKQQAAHLHALKTQSDAQLATIKDLRAANKALEVSE
jgi:hypothetical protein